MVKPTLLVTLLLPLVVAVFQSCGDAATSHAPAPDTSHKTTPDTTALQNQIVPGERLGHITLGMNADSLETVLGYPDASDAAMGKAWLTWNGKNNPSVLNIYTAYKDTTLTQKTVQQIRTTSSFFKTPNGTHVGQSLAQIKQQFPAMAATSTYTEAGAAYTLYDDVAAGIAFEVRASTCTGILIHKKGHRADDIYIMLHPDMKKR